VSAVSQLVVYIVGQGGAIFKSFDGGVTFFIQPAAAQAMDLWAVHFANASTGWAVGAPDNAQVNVAAILACVTYSVPAVLPLETILPARLAGLGWTS
jgi:hypothetical protein